MTVSWHTLSHSSQKGLRDDTSRGESVDIDQEQKAQRDGRKICHGRNAKARDALSIDFI